jgi:cytosine/adenosine deaminase-related metal-dependent hydrolase
VTRVRIAIHARNMAVVVEDGWIAPPGTHADIVLELPDAELRAGLINAHDHLHRNHYGRLGRGAYRSAYEWADDIQTRDADAIAAGARMPRRDALLVGAWKNLFAGVTRVVHHDRWEDDFDRDFPIRVVRVPNADSLGMTPELAGVRGDRPFCVHLAEGIDPRAACELDVLDRRGLLTPSLLAVHGVGIEAGDAARFRNAGAALIWCPTSNLFLFGRTAPRALFESGADVLLGSDSLLTGAGDLLDELRHARSLGLLDDHRLAGAVGETAARRLGVPVPSLHPGAPADLVVLRRPLLAASAHDVLLVLIDGAPRVARPDLVSALGPLCQNGIERTVGEVVRWTSARRSFAEEIVNVR